MPAGDETDLDAAEPLLRPVWEDTPDEADADRLGQRQPVAAPRALLRRPGANAWSAGEALHEILAPLCAATAALARLDGRAAMAPEAVREGLIARMAFAEAAGWLAHAHAWVHPLDLALRDLGLAGPAALAGLGGGRQVMRHTFAAGPTDWDAPSLDDIAAGDRAVADALALARVLRRVPGAPGERLFGTRLAAEATVAPFGAGALDAMRFDQWAAAFLPAAALPRRASGGAGEGAPPGLPPLLLAARAAGAWMESGIADLPTPLQAALAAVGVIGRSRVARGVLLPVWAAYPALGAGDRDALPGLRGEVAARLVGSGASASWTMAFLHLVAEGARGGLRELDRLVVAAEQGRGPVATCDPRSRLPDALDAALRIPALTPKALARRLRIAPQTATALLRELCAAGLVREVTGRKSFRAFAV